jgi:hypothetical protein
MTSSNFLLKYMSSSCLAATWKRSKLSLTPSFRSRFSARCLVHQRWCKGAYQCISSCMTFSMPWCLLDLMPTSLPSPTTCIRTSLKNHPQLSLFSLSTKENAKGTSLLFAPQDMAMRSVPCYLPIKNVPSMEKTRW